MLGNNPFIIRDPRTNKKYLVAFPESIVSSGIDFNQITAKVLSGGTQLEERRASGLTFNADGSIDLDYIAPSGSLAVSQNGGKYAGTLTITATVADNVAVARVDFYIDYEKLSTDATAPYAAIWDTLKHKNGNRRVWAKIYDTAGNLAEISRIIIVENDRTPPTVPVMTACGAVTYGSIVFNWTAATDNVAVTNYDLQIAADAGFASIIAAHNLGNVLTFAKSGLSPATTYYARVRAKDAAGNASQYSPGISAATTAVVSSAFVNDGDEILVSDDGAALTDF